MKQESDHSFFTLVSVVIVIIGLAAIAYLIITGNAKKTRNQFFLLLGIHVDTRHPEYQKGTPRNHADYQLQLRAPFIISARKAQKR